MQAEVVKDAAQQDTGEQAWREHCLTAVKKFLKNAVVIDNEPFVKSRDHAAHLDSPVLAPDDGMSEDCSTPMVSSEGPSIKDQDPHVLDIRKVSDAFAEAGLACAFVLPDDENPDEDQLVKRVLNAALISDIVVIDWYLYNDSPNLTKRILEEIAKNDVAENGRMRFICVYTGQPILDQIYIDIRDSLAAGGINVDEVSAGLFSSKKHSSLVMVLNKQSVLPGDLPSKLIDSFANFSNGLLPSFALAAVGAIRKNIHHMVTRFGKELDSAYVANRLITNPPEDVAELVRDLLVAECDNALGLESVADFYLDREAIRKWLCIKKTSIVSQDYGNKKVDLSLLHILLQNGIGDKGVLADDGKLISLPPRDRKKVSIALAGGEYSSTKAELSFSRLVIFKREAFGDTKLISNEGWLPSLTTGTLLRLQEGETKRYFLCLTPACDTSRLLKETPFVFLEAVVDDARYSVPLREETGENRGLYFREKHPSLRTYSFLPHSGSQRVRGEQNAPSGAEPFFTFSTEGAKENFTWLGEIRYERAASEMAKLAGNWMRIGINDSEYLRLLESGKFIS
jgi:hypothetical protein